MKNLKKIREAAGYNQSQVARKLNISRQTYNNYELGRRQADYETLLKLSEFFNTSVDALLRDDASVSFDKSVNFLENIKKELPHSAKESERERIVSMIADRLGECPEQDIDDMLMFLDFLDFRRRVE